MMLNRFRPIYWNSLAATLLWLCFADGVIAEAPNWTGFRGPNGSAFVPSGSIPNQWSDEDYAWKLQLPGAGVGSLAVFDGRVYLVNSEPDKSRRSVVAIDLESGQIVWEKYSALQSHHVHNRNSFASTTPFVDASGVYVTWADPEQVTLASFDHDGNLRWQRDLGAWQSQHGYGTSPVIYDGKLILFNSQQADQLQEGQVAGESHMMAFDPATGKSLWSTRLNATRACYGVPALHRTAQGGAQIIGANTGDGIFALDLETGAKQWSLKVFNARCVSSPLLVNGLMVGTAGSGGGGNHLVAVRLDGEGETVAPVEAFRVERFAPYVPTPAVVGDRLYMVDDKGIASCLDMASGDTVWYGRLGGGFGASPIVVGEKMLVIGLDGEASVLATGDKFQSLATFALGGPVQATPSYSEGALLLRVGNTICCLRGNRT
jgi:outer membrane protein assembly factor BamB